MGITSSIVYSHLDFNDGDETNYNVFYFKFDVQFVTSFFYHYSILLCLCIVTTSTVIAKAVFRNRSLSRI